MKKIIALLLAFVCFSSLLSACSKGGNIDETTAPSSSQTMSSVPADDSTPEINTVSFTQIDFEITLPDYYATNGSGIFESKTEEGTEIRVLDYPLSVNDEGIIDDRSLWELTREHVDNHQIVGVLLEGMEDNYYILNEGTANEKPWTELMLFYGENDILWEIRFYSDSRSWNDVRDQWSRYIESIEFN